MGLYKNFKQRLCTDLLMFESVIRPWGMEYDMQLCVTVTWAPAFCLIDRGNILTKQPFAFPFGFRTLIRCTPGYLYGMKWGCMNRTGSLYTIDHLQSLLEHLDHSVWKHLITATFAGLAPQSSSNATLLKFTAIADQFTTTFCLSCKVEICQHQWYSCC